MKTLFAAVGLLFIGAMAATKSDQVVGTYHDCAIDGSQANYAGYLSAAEFYKCREGRIRIEGKWGEEIQGGWRYHTEFGRSASGPDYIGDEPAELQMPKFQKWCKSKNGYSLCGWNEEEEQRQRELRQTRKAPPFKSGI